MANRRGKVPSLLTSSSGTPEKSIAGKKRVCKRCAQDILKGDNCFEVPKPGVGFKSIKTYCQDCFQEMLEKTQTDLDGLKAMIEL